MKPSCIILTFLIFVSVALHANDNDSLDRSENPRRKFVLKTNPVAMVWGPVTSFFRDDAIYPLFSEYRIVGEMRLNENSSLQAGASYLGRPFVNNSPFRDGNTVSGYRIQGMVKYYFRKKAMTGIYLGPYASYVNGTDKSNVDPREYRSFVHTSVCLLFGYQVITPFRFTVDMNVGGGYRNNLWYRYSAFSIPEKLNGSNSVMDYIKLMVSANIGYAF